MGSFVLNSVYVKDKYTVASKKEKEGPLNEFIDYFFKDNYCGCKSYEKAEQELNKKAIDSLLLNNPEVNIDLVIGSDLLNQISSSNYVMRNYDIPFIGTYSACAASGLNIILASIFIDKFYMNNIVVFASSHNNSAERQFRFPIEYGVQKKETTTYTVTGSGAILLTNKRSDIKIKSITIGKVIDYGMNDVNDFGAVMAISAFDTFKRHFKELKLPYDYYDLILTGDLSKRGKDIFKELLFNENIIVKEYNDCGVMIYDINKQNVFLGGSGCACSLITVFSYIYTLIREGTYKRVLIIATGALLSNTIINQKETIPSIAHAYSLELNI